MNLEIVGGREDGQGNELKGETKAECKNWWKNCE